MKNSNAPTAKWLLVKRSLAALLILSTVCASIGCGCDEREPTDLYLCFDNSESNKKNLPADANSGAKVGSSLDSPDRLFMFRLNRTLAEFNSGALYESRTELAKTLSNELSIKAPGPGTWPHLFFREVAARISQSSRCSIVILYHDGYADCEPPGAHEELLDAIHRLSKNPKVFVAICSANPDTVIQLKHDFEPLGNRFGVFSPDQLDLEVIRESITTRL